MMGRTEIQRQSSVNSKGRDEEIPGLLPWQQNGPGKALKGQLRGREMMLLVEFIDNQEAGRPARKVVIGGKRGRMALAKEKTASTRTQPMSLPSFVASHSLKALCWGCPYLRSLLRSGPLIPGSTDGQVCANEFLHSICFSAQSCFPSSHSSSSERMYKFIKGAALIPCPLNIRQYQAANFY